MSDSNLKYTLSAYWKDIYACVSSKEVFAVCLALFLTALVLYQKVFKKKYNLPPGPVGLPVLGYIPFLGHEPFKELDRLKKVYGNVFSLYLGRTLVVILGDFEAVKDAFGKSTTLDRPARLFDFMPDGVGIVAFDETTGFWLVHSIPKFGDEDRFEYPDNALINGQSILCVTFRTAELNEICNQLIYSHPNIYAYGITDEISALLDNKANSLFTDSPSFIKADPLTRSAALKSLGNKVFVSFAKDNQYHEDLFSDIIAPGLKSSLLAETWRRGSGTALKPSCQSDYSVLDIVSINMTITNRRNSKVIAFKSTEDHSKWAIAENSGRNWVCIADMNRMMSQEKRGGGALCFVSSNVRNAYSSIIAETDQCPKRRRSGKK